LKLLLDTHTLVWWLHDSPLLGKAARAAIMDEDTEILVSAASAMEVTTKYRLGKWPESQWLALNFMASIADEGFLPLPISLGHAALAGSLRLNHKDPFDRFLIAQAQMENVPLISNEKIFDQFGIERIW
jgi:PIN domain nuclease of toxin-antitoxin system